MLKKVKVFAFKPKMFTFAMKLINQSQKKTHIMQLSETSIKRLGLISIVNCEIEGMNLENTRYRTAGMQSKYSEKDFQEKANKLKMIVYADGNTIEKLAWEIGETLN